MDLPKRSLVYCANSAQGNIDARCSIPTKGDNTDGVGSYLSTFLFGVLANDWVYHLVDMAKDWTDPKDAPKILEAGSRAELKILELYPWKEMQSDEAISRFSFAGIAAHRMQGVHGDPEGIAYKNEWAWVSSFDVRPGFESYGANAYFDKQGTLIKMYWPHGGKK